LKRLVPLAIDRAVREIISPVVQRSCTIACITTRELILKDFGQETDVNRIRQAAHQMVEYLAGALSLVTCKDPIRLQVSAHLRSLLASSGVDGDVLEHTVSVVAAENLSVCCRIIEHAGLNRAAKDIDEHLRPALQQRQQNQHNVKSGYNGFPGLFQSPSPGPHGNQMRVYDDFLRLSRLSNSGLSGGSSPPLPSQSPPALQRQPSPLSLVGAKAVGAAASRGQSAGLGLATSKPETPQPLLVNPPQLVQQTEAPLSTQQVLERFNNIYPTLVSAIQVAVSSSKGDLALAELPLEHEVQRLWTQIPAWVRRSTTADEAGMAVAQKVFQRLFEGDSTLHREVHVAILEALRDSCKRLPKDLVSWLMYSDEQRKFHRDCIVALMKPGNILNLTEYDAYLAKAIDNGRNSVALDFAAFIVRRCILEDSLATPAQLFSTLEVLQKVGTRSNPASIPSAPEGLSSLVESVRSQGARRINASDEEDAADLDPAIYSIILENWRSICTTAKGISADRVNKKAFIQSTLRDLLDTDEGKERFFRYGVDSSVESCQDNLIARDSEGADKHSSPGASAPYAAVDTFALLIAAIVNTQSKGIAVLSLALKVITRRLRGRAEQQTGQAADLRPYFRFLSNLMIEFCGSARKGGSNEDATLGEGHYGVLVVFKEAFESVRPQIVPAFAFSYLELISSRHFMPQILSQKENAWSLLEKLLVDMLSFLYPYLQTSNLTDSIRTLYRGTLRFLLVLYEFPEFLCAYHFSLCDVIPPNCIQMRNIVTSAYPLSINLPDPFNVDLKVDMIPEMSVPPTVLSDYMSAIVRANVKNQLDNYLKGRVSAAIFLDVRPKILLPYSEREIMGSKYNIPVINSIVLYIGQQAVNKMLNANQLNRYPYLDMFQTMAIEFDAEGRYHFLNAIVNQLRYANLHTHYFSYVLRYLYAEAKQEIIQEQITRVLVERCKGYKPHPWGVLLTFTELMKSPRYNFLDHAFVKSAPGIEGILKTLAKHWLKPAELASREELMYAREIGSFGTPEA